MALACRFDINTRQRWVTAIAGAACVLQAHLPPAVKAEVCAEGRAMHGPHCNSNATGGAQHPTPPCCCLPDVSITSPLRTLL
jgi:hypothetical protein